MAQIEIDAGVGGEIAEFDPVVALVVGRTPLVADAEIERELRVHFPVILEIEPRLCRPVGHGGIDDEVQWRRWITLSA